VVLLLLLVMRRSLDVVRGVVPQLAEFLCWSVVSVMVSINQCYSRRGSPIYGASSGSPIMWRFVGVTKYVGYCRSVMV